MLIKSGCGSRFRMPAQLPARACFHCRTTAGCNVLVEKPMAASMAEAKKMNDTAAKQVNCSWLIRVSVCFPPMLRPREVMDSGIMGKVLHITAMFGHSGPEDWSPTGKWFFDKKQARFGAMADLGVHKAGPASFPYRQGVSEVNGFFERLEKPRATVEDNFVSALKFTDGTVGTLAASWTVKGAEANYTVLHCTNGTLQICLFPDRPLVRLPGKATSAKLLLNFHQRQPTMAGGWGLDAGGKFCRAIKGEEEPYCSGLEGMNLWKSFFSGKSGVDKNAPLKSNTNIGEISWHKQYTFPWANGVMTYTSVGIF